MTGNDVLQLVRYQVNDMQDTVTSYYDKMNAINAANRFMRRLALEFNPNILNATETASIDPTATGPYMVDGAYTVNIKGNAAAWLNAETATLTVNVADQDPGGGTTDYSVLGYAVAAKTAVLTFTT